MIIDQRPGWPDDRTQQERVRDAMDAAAQVLQNTRDNDKVGQFAALLAAQSYIMHGLDVLGYYGGDSGESK